MTYSYPAATADSSHGWAGAPFVHLPAGDRTRGGVRRIFGGGRCSTDGSRCSTGGSRCLRSGKRRRCDGSWCSWGGRCRARSGSRRSPGGSPRTGEGIACQREGGRRSLAGDEGGGQYRQPTWLERRALAGWRLPDDPVWARFRSLHNPSRMIQQELPASWCSSGIDPGAFMTDALPIRLIQCPAGLGQGAFPRDR